MYAANEKGLKKCFAALKIPHRFNKEKGAAGKHFYYDFMQRHPDISLRIPESTSMMRAIGFNKPQVDLFMTTWKE